MPPVCSICSHPKRTAIDTALVSGESSFRNMAERFSVSLAALNRHKNAHLPVRLVKAKDVREQTDATDIMAELQRCFTRVNKLFDACDAWLTDPNNPDQYDIGPRAEELDITYTEQITDRNGTPRTIRKKARLSALLAEVKGESRDWVLIETKHADPRDLVLKAAGRLNSQVELLARLIGELDERATVNVLIAPEWAAVRSTLLDALQPFPDARYAVSAALSSLQGVQHVA